MTPLNITYLNVEMIMISFSTLFSIPVSNPKLVLKNSCNETPFLDFPGLFECFQSTIFVCCPCFSLCHCFDLFIYIWILMRNCISQLFPSIPINQNLFIHNIELDNSFSKRESAHLQRGKIRKSIIINLNLITSILCSIST